MTALTNRDKWIVSGVVGGIVVGVMLAVGVFDSPAPKPSVTMAQATPPCSPYLLKEGMSRKDVLTACGKPTVINYDDGNGGNRSEQWVYNIEERSSVYLTNGAVTSWQWREKP